MLASRKQGKDTYTHKINLTIIPVYIPCTPAQRCIPRLLFTLRYIETRGT